MKLFWKMWLGTKVENIKVDMWKIFRSTWLIKVDRHCSQIIFFRKGDVVLSIHAMVFERNKVENLKVNNRDICWIEEVTYFECKMWEENAYYSSWNLSHPIILNMKHTLTKTNLYIFIFSICHWLVGMLCTAKKMVLLQITKLN